MPSHTAKTSTKKTAKTKSPAPAKRSVKTVAKTSAKRIAKPRVRTTTKSKTRVTKPKTVARPKTTVKRKTTAKPKVKTTTKPKTAAKAKTNPKRKTRAQSVAEAVSKLNVTPAAKPKSAARKTVSRKKVARKALAKPKIKTVSKKTPVKKKVAAKTTSKSKKVIYKTKSAIKPAAKTKTKRETVATLAQSLKSLETRLKGADTRNRNAVKALGKTVTEIKATAKQGSTTQKAALTRGLNKLEARMGTYLERATAEAKAGVRSDLASVTAAGADFATLEKAVKTAHNRLNQVYASQNEAFARVNRHVSDLAAAMDKQLATETQNRKTATAELDAKISSVRDHVDQVEEETANALEAVGAKVAEFATVLEQRAKTSDSETAERLADLAQETKSEITATQSDLKTRLEALEVIAAAWSPTQTAAPANPYLPANQDDPRIDQMGNMIASLQEELSRMHARIATVQHAAHTETVQKPALAPTNVMPMAIAQQQVQENPYAAPVETPAPQAPEPPAPTPPTPKRESHVPQEFDPSAFEANQAAFKAQHGENPPKAPYASASIMPAAIQPAPQPLTQTLTPTPPPVAPPMASTGSHTPIPQTPPPLPPELTQPKPVQPQTENMLLTAPEPVSTYDDPAYAEEDEMRAERIGDIGKPRKSRPKLSIPKLPISSQNLRVGGLAVGVAVAGLFAAKTILGSPESGSINAGPGETQDASFTAPSQNTVSQSINQPAGQPSAQTIDFGSPSAAADANAPSAPSAPLGQYAETKAPTFDSSKTTTLDAAVEAGDPIAQFQKGLAQLQSGQTAEGARLIRLSANRNQPAAQYRLAKLYETGTGLAKDEITARELIERAARGGNRIAMHDLGNYHAYGQGGLQQDIASALDWFTKAAERGVVDSQFNVAFLSEGNEGIPADIETAYFWYQIAARQGDQGAPDRIALLDEKLDPAKQAEIKARAESFNPKPVDEAANGVFRNVAWAKQASTGQSSEKSAEILKIRDAQTLLGQLGYQVGTPDGISGKKTREAVKSFEAVNGLPETGQITDDLIERLEIATGA